jgi:hypothetical protein
MVCDTIGNYIENHVQDNFTLSKRGKKNLIFKYNIYEILKDTHLQRMEY